jgi:Protein of unknown function (DUF2764)
MRSNSYYMLVSSLPPLPVRFEVARLPITLERLQGRLRMLEPEDADEIGRIMSLLEWSAQSAATADAAIVRRYEELLHTLRSPLSRTVITAGMNMRMVMAALRRRRQGLGPPRVGIGEWFGHIRRHFQQADFALGHVFSWLVPFDQLLEHDDVLTLYQRVLGETWAFLRKLEQDYDTFAFEAVVLYMARWDIIRRWQRLEPERGRKIFEALVTEAMGEHAAI